MKKVVMITTGGYYMNIVTERVAKLMVDKLGYHYATDKEIKAWDERQKKEIKDSKEFAMGLSKILKGG